jgi:hypothetical protein
MTLLNTQSEPKHIPQFFACWTQRISKLAVDTKTRLGRQTQMLQFIADIHPTLKSEFDLLETGSVPDH